MALNVGELMAVVKIDDSQFTNGLNRAQGAFESFGSRLGSVVTTGAALAGTALVSMGTLAAVTGIKTAASMQQAQVAFTTLLGSGQKAQSFLQQLSQFAAATPFELPGLIDASRQLLGVGQSAESVIPTLTALGNTSGALGLSQEEFSRVMLAVTQSMAKGKLEAQDLMQITEAGIPIWKILSEALGKPVAEIQDLSSKGKLLANDVWPKVFSVMNKDYGGAMAAQSKTLNGVWSTLTDTVKMSLAQAFQPAIPILSNVIPKAANVLGTAIGSIPKAFSSASSVIRELVDRYGPRFSGVFEGAKKTVDTLGQFFTKVFNDISTVVERNRGTIDTWVTKIASAWQTIEETVNNATKIISILWDMMGSKIVQTVITVFGNVITTLQGLFNLISGIVKIALALLTGDWHKAWDGIKQSWQGTWQIIQGILQAALNTIILLIQAAWSLISSTILGFLKIIWSAITSAFDAIAPYLSYAWQRIVAEAQREWNNFKQQVSADVKQIITFITDLGGIPGMIGSYFQGASNAAVGVLRGLITWVGSVPGAILNALGNLGSLLFQAGQNIISGLLNGIKNGVTGMLNYVKSIAGQIASVKGPREYDLRVLTPNGRWLMDGLEQGISDGMPKVLSKVSSIASMISGQMRSGLSNTSLQAAPSSNYMNTSTQANTAALATSPTVHIQNYYTQDKTPNRVAEDLWFLTKARR